MKADKCTFDLNLQTVKVSKFTNLLTLFGWYVIYVIVYRLSRFEDEVLTKSRIATGCASCDTLKTSRCVCLVHNLEKENILFKKNAKAFSYPGSLSAVQTLKRLYDPPELYQVDISFPKLNPVQ